MPTSEAAATVKAIKTGKQTEEPGIRKITLRGVEYTIRELDVNEYDECLAAAEDKETGAVPFGKLLKQMVLRAVRPMSATPFKFPVYRTLEGIVNEMHYTDVPNDADAEQPDQGSDGETGDTDVPNA